MIAYEMLKCSFFFLMGSNTSKLFICIIRKKMNRETFALTTMEMVSYANRSPQGTVSLNIYLAILPL